MTCYRIDRLSLGGCECRRVVRERGGIERAWCEVRAPGEARRPHLTPPTLSPSRQIVPCSTSLKGGPASNRYVPDPTKLIQFRQSNLMWHSASIRTQKNESYIMGTRQWGSVMANRYIASPSGNGHESLPKSPVVKTGLLTKSGGSEKGGGRNAIYCCSAKPINNI